MIQRSMAWPTEAAYTYRVDVVKVIDGDTIDVDIDLGCHVKIRRRLRFLRVNAWETRGPERTKGMIAKARLTDLLESAQQVLIQTQMDEEGKYGRLLADVFAQIEEVPAVEGELVTRHVHINQLLIDEGHGIGEDFV